MNSIRFVKSVGFVLVLGYCFLCEQQWRLVHVFYDLLFTFTFAISYAYLRQTPRIRLKEELRQLDTIVDQLDWIDIILVIGEDVVFVPGYYYQSTVVKVVAAVMFSFIHISYKSFNLCLLMSIQFVVTTHLHNSIVTHVMKHLLCDVIIFSLYRLLPPEESEFVRIARRVRNTRIQLENPYEKRSMVGTDEGSPAVDKTEPISEQPIIDGGERTERVGGTFVVGSNDLRNPAPREAVRSVEGEI